MSSSLNSSNHDKHVQPTISTNTYTDTNQATNHFERHIINYQIDTIIETQHESSSLFLSSSVKEESLNKNTTNILRNFKLFPIFNSQELAKISPNYYLYLEFYNVAIRVFSKVFVISLVSYLAYWILCHLDKEWENKDQMVKSFTGFTLFICFFVRFALEQENKRILENDQLYDSQWSEEHFALLAEGFPKSVSKQEIKEYFDSLISKERFGGSVLDVILIQDYNEYLKVKNELDDKIKKFEKNDENTALASKITTLENKLNQMETEYRNFLHFKGKAIVIFDAMRPKVMLTRYFSHGFFKSIFMFFFRSCFNSYNFHNHRITIKELPEPQDLVIQNLHYPLTKQIIYKPFSYVVSLIVILCIFYILEDLELLKIHDEGTSILNKSFASYIIIAFTLALSYALEKLYYIAQKLIPYTSILEVKVRHLDFGFFVSIVLFVSSQVALGYGDFPKLTAQLIKLAFFYALKVSVKNAFIIYSSQKTLQHLPGKTINNLSVNLLNKVQSAFVQFGFITGIRNGLPLILIGMCLSLFNPILILPVLIGLLYGFTILDKYRMLKCCDVYTSKSAAHMTIPFKYYRWMPFMVLGYGFTIAGVFCALNLGKDFGSSKPFLSLMLITIMGMIFFFCCCPKSLDLRVQEKFFERNAYVRYEAVCKEFSSFYKDVLPVNENHNLNDDL